MLQTSSKDRSRMLQGFYLAIVGAVLFSLKGVVMKLALLRGANVEQILVMRMGFALPVYLLVMIIVSRKKVLSVKKQDYLKAAGLGLIGYYVCSWLNFTGLQFISAQLERLIMFVYPTITAVLVWVFLKERFNRAHGLALAISYCGIVTLFGRELEVQGSYVALGAGLVFLSAALFAAYVTAMKGLVERMGSPLFTSVALSAACIAILVHFSVLVSVTTVPDFTNDIIGLAVLLTIACTILPSFMMGEAIARIGPGPASAMGSVGPVATAIVAVWVLGEPFGVFHVIALTLTLAGVAVLIRANRQDSFKRI